MAEPDFFSVRMHSQQHGHHHSGGERLVQLHQVEQAGYELISRALHHSRGCAETIHLTVDALAGQAVRKIPIPAVTTLGSASVSEAREHVYHLLMTQGVDRPVAQRTVQCLSEGAAGGGKNMRGAMLVDCQTGERFEPDKQRGIRVSRMDIAPALEATYKRQLKQMGLDQPQVYEALLLAAKVLSTDEIVAELCWSDDPDYTVGYVATPSHGYTRIPHLKEAGTRQGGRAFFCRPQLADCEALIDYLEQTPVLIDTIDALQRDQR